jgi:hypothetical protein
MTCVHNHHGSIGNHFGISGPVQPQSVRSRIDGLNAVNAFTALVNNHYTMIARVADQQPAVTELLSAVWIIQLNGTITANDSMNTSQPIDFKNHVVLRVGNQEMPVL